jgi:hypothetical protein
MGVLPFVAVAAAAAVLLAVALLPSVFAGYSEGLVALAIVALAASLIWLTITVGPWLTLFVAAVLGFSFSLILIATGVL